MATDGHRPVARVDDVVVLPLGLPAPFVTDAGLAPPAPGAASELRLLSFEALRDGHAAALSACMTTHLAHGFSMDEVAPLALDALRDLGARKLDLTDVRNGPQTAAPHGTVRREDLARSPGGTPATIVSELGFTRRGDLVACVSSCSDVSTCGNEVRAARLAGALSPPPPPGLALSGLLAGVHHPEAALTLLVLVALVGSALAVGLRRRPRTPF